MNCPTLIIAWGILMTLPFLAQVEGITEGTVGWSDPQVYLALIAAVSSSLVVVAGFIYRIKDGRRKRNLIIFPIEKWQVTHNASKNTLEVFLSVRVLTPYHAVACMAQVMIEGKRVPISEQALNQPMLRREEWHITFNMALSELPKDAQSFEVKVTVILDGGLTRKTYKATLAMPEKPLVGQSERDNNAP